MNRVFRSMGHVAAGIVGAACVHELGHCVAGWAQGIPMVPTPFKEYVVQEEIAWHVYTWISLGGVAASVLTAGGVLIWYLRRDQRHGDAILAGVLVSPAAYALRFALLGRGHDGLEWQAAQNALGGSPSGHAVDILFLVVSLLIVATWIFRRSAGLRPSLVIQAGGTLILGVALLVVFQTLNNRLFDPLLLDAQVVDVPPGIESR